MFTTGDYRKWLVATKTSVLGWYHNGYRPVLKSSRYSTHYHARWYRRTGNYEDPWISLGNYNSEVIHGEASTSGNNHLPYHYQGARVFIRDSTGNTDISCLGPNGVIDKMGCQWTPGKEKLIQSNAYCPDNSKVLSRPGKGFSITECNQMCQDLPNCVNFVWGASRCDLVKAGCARRGTSGMNYYQLSDTVEPKVSGINFCTVAKTSRTFTET